MAQVLRSAGFRSVGLVAAFLMGIVATQAVAADGGGRRGGGPGAAAGGGGRGAAPAAPLTPGEQVFSDSCSVCHRAESGAPTVVAPNLFGIVGRKSATEAGFFYSPAMKAANLTWNPVTLTAFLTSPQQVVPGTKMGFLGFIDPADTANVIAYLSTRK